MPDVEFVEAHQTSTGAKRSGCRVVSPMAEMYVAGADNRVLGRTYACAMTAEQYRRLNPPERTDA